MDGAKVLLDTSIVIEILRNNQAIAQSIVNIGWGNCCISEITVVELLYGAECSKNAEQNIKTVKSIIKSFKVIPFKKCIKHFCKEKARLKNIGKMIDDNDLYIGTTAVSLGIKAFTLNKKHFERIKDLDLYPIP